MRAMKPIKRLSASAIKFMRTVWCFAVRLKRDHGKSGQLVARDVHITRTRCCSRVQIQPCIQQTNLQVPTYRAGHFRYFLIFSLIKNDFLHFFIKLIWLGVGFLNRTGAEIGYQLDKKCKEIIFYYWKNEKIPEVPSSGVGEQLYDARLTFLGRFRFFT